MENIIISKEISKKVNNLGGQAYFVGGYVRDKIMGKENFDIDIEIHGIYEKNVEEILSEFGSVNIIGKSFGVYNISDYNIDISLPRKDVSIGYGHKDFRIEVDPFLGQVESARRRDFTINSIMENIYTGEIIDNFNGVNDIERKVIRHIDDISFIDDPLRVFRACQFASRLDFEIDNKTIELCKNVEIKFISKERVYQETNKALLKSVKPSKYFDSLSKMDKLNYWFEEIEKLKTIDQSPKFHKEGNVYKHTMMVLDIASSLLDKVNNRLYFMYAALCHDLGKISSTQTIDGVIHSYNHEIKGIEISDKFLRRLTNDKKLIRYVRNMVKLHMKPNTYASHNSKVSSSNKMFYESIDANDLIYLAIADHYGRITDIEIDNPENYLFERYKIFNEYMKRDYVKGKDLIKLEIPPSNIFSELLDYSTKLRMAGVEKSDALSQIKSYYNKIRKNLESRK